jgi:predicted metalloprotease with PDZ domain
MRMFRTSLVVLLLTAALATPALATAAEDEAPVAPRVGKAKTKVKHKAAKAKPKARPKAVGVKALPAKGPARLPGKGVADGKPWLGVTLAEVSALDRRQRGIPKHGGVLIEDVLAAGPAAKAGFSAGDVIMRLAGEYVYAPSEVISRVSRSRVGGAVKIDIIRNGKWMTADLRLTPRPDKFASPRAEAVAAREDVPAAVKSVAVRPAARTPAVDGPAAAGAADPAARRLESLEKELRLLRKAILEMKGQCSARTE